MSGDLAFLCSLAAESCSFTDGFVFLLSFKGDRTTTFPSNLLGRQHFLKLLLRQIQNSNVFEGPDGSKNLALDSQGTRPGLLTMIPFYELDCIRTRTRSDVSASCVHSSA